MIDGLGHPLDGLGPIQADEEISLNLPPPHPLKRQRIRQPFRTGIKAIDTFIPCGRGQRLGIFAGSGVGKSTLLGMIASQAEADVNVIALIGERGREVREFLEKDLDETGRRKSVVVVATSNQPAIARSRARFVAMAIAEHFRDTGPECFVDDGFGDALCDGPAGNRPGRGRTAHHARLHAVGFFAAAAIAGARRHRRSKAPSPACSPCWWKRTT